MRINARENIWTDRVCYFPIIHTRTKGVCYVSIIPTFELETSKKGTLESTSDLCPRLEYLLDADDKDGGDGEDGPEYLDSVGDVTKDDDLKQQGDYDAASILHQADNMGLLYLNGFDG